MTKRSESRRPTLSRFPTGVRGLDQITLGGLFSGGIYLVMGPPGSGKTILANQVCFSQVKDGGHAVYLTLLAESHDRMHAHLHEMTFFDRTRIGRGVSYFSAYQQLEKQGVAGLGKFLRHEILASKPTVLIVDGISVASDVAGSTVAFKKFVHELANFTAHTGCTAILLTSIDEGFNRPEHTMVDGIIGMTMVTRGMRTFREIEVRKLRGAAHLQGRHHFRISTAGIDIFPRLEALLPSPSAQRPPGRPVSTGIVGLDRITGGGIPSGTVTVLLGAAGTGKTILGTHFLVAGLAKKEPGLYFGFYETPASFIGKAKRLGFNIDAPVSAGLLSVVWHSPTEHSMDDMALQLLDLVKKHQVKRLFLDGANGLYDVSLAGDRLHPFMTALMNELRALGVTTVMSDETRLFDPVSDSAVSDLAAVTENIIFMRSVELDSRLERMISVVKTRDGDCDRTIHRFTITDSGIHIDGRFDGVEQLLSGRPIRTAAPKRRSATRPPVKRRKGT